MPFGPRVNTNDPRTFRCPKCTYLVDLQILAGSDPIHAFEAPMHERDIILNPASSLILCPQCSPNKYLARSRLPRKFLFLRLVERDAWNAAAVNLGISTAARNVADNAASPLVWIVAYTVQPTTRSRLHFSLVCEESLRIYALLWTRPSVKLTFPLSTTVSARLTSPRTSHPYPLPCGRPARLCWSLFAKANTSAIKIGGSGGGRAHETSEELLTCPRQAGANLIDFRGCSYNIWPVNNRYEGARARRGRADADATGGNDAQRPSCAWRQRQPGLDLRNESYDVTIGDRRG
ncbi:hypothetical protein B0H13DRAFT_1874167 [Mycena leptocephala]|nr:hypothetical protein B0H13DRAFT_1874167 [Mycena leptocephala]